MNQMLTTSNGMYSCSPDDMGDFFLELAIVLIAGFGIGLISHDSLKTFRLIMRIYVYILLPCGVISGVFGVYFNWDNYKERKFLWDVLTAETLTKCIIWSSTITGFWFMYKSKKSLVYAAVCGQFVIQGNNIGYALNLYKKSCNITANNTEHVTDHPFLFESLSYLSTYINFVFFLPLTHGVITLAKRNRSMNLLNKFKLFKEAFLYQQSQVCLSTFAFIISMVIILIASILKLRFGVTAQLSYYDTLASGPLTLSKLAMTLLTLSTGVYFHHLLFHLDISKVCMKNTIVLTLIISFIYPAISLLLHGLISDEELSNHFDIVMIQYSVPASPYSQHFALKHSNDPMSIIVAFFASTFLSPVIGLATALVEKARSDNTRTPIEYYTESQRYGYLIISVILTSITILMFAKFNQEGKKRMIFFLAINEILSMICKIIATFMMLNNGPDTSTSAKQSDFVMFGMILFCHLVCCSLTILLLAMISFPLFSRNKYAILVSAVIIYSVSIILPLCLCLGYSHQSDNYDTKNIDYLLDLNDTDNGRHQRASITYVTANTMMIITVIAMIIYNFKNTATRRRNTPFDSTPAPSTADESREL